MNLSELFRYLKSKRINQVLALTGKGEEERLFAPLLTSLRMEVLEVTDSVLSLKPEDKPRTLEITGKASFPPLLNGEAFLVSVQCEGEGETMRFSLTAACSATSSFQDFWGFLYPVDPTAVSGLDFSDEDVQNITILHPVISTESERLSETLPFHVSGSVSFHNLGGGWGAFAALLTGTPNMEGDFTFLDFLSIPYRVRMDLLGDFHFSPANAGHRANPFNNVGLSLILYNGVDDAYADYGKISTAEFLCQVSLQGLATPVSLNAPVFSRPDYLAFRVGFEKGLGIGDIVNFMASLFQVGNDTGNLLIPNNSLINGIKLTGLSFLMKRDEDVGLQMQMVEVDVRNVNPIQLLPMVTLEDLHVNWSVMWGDGETEDSYYLSAQIDANVRISLFNQKSLLFYAKGRLPELELEARLALANDGYNFADVLGSAAADVPGYEGSPSVIGGVELYASYQNRVLDILAYANNLLSFPIGNVTITLQRVYAGARLTQQGNRYSFGGIIAFDSEDNAFRLSLDGVYENALWTFSGGLSHGSIDIGGLILAFFGIRADVKAGGYLSILLTELDVHFSYKKGVTNRFTLKAGFSVEWGGFIFQNVSVDAGGRILLETEENKTTNLSVILGLHAGGFGISVQVINFFSDAAQYVVEVRFGKASIKGSYYKDGNLDEIIAIALSGLTLGDVVSTVASFLYPNFKYGLPAPWNVLDKVDLSRLSLHVNLTGKKATFSYQLNVNILGLFRINEVKLTYDYGRNAIEMAVVTDERELSWDPVMETPPAGNGKVPFTLYYIGMAQHVSTDGVKKANSIAEAIDALKSDFKPTSGELPTGLRYDDETNWLFGMDFLVNNALSVKLVLNDPQIYGLLITVKSEEAPFAAFNGLVLELLYKKVTKDVGMFRATLVLPDRFRRFRLGYVTVTLGVVCVEIYTNGNFLIDLGFPYNKNFSRSFQIEVGIYTGKGGFYFGSLNGQTCNQLPAVKRGSFDTVVTLGFGLSIGIGRSFDFGVVAGGFSVEVFGIFEGLFAVYKPEKNAKSELYYYAKASVGIIGRLFLSVDFKIISIDASVEIRAYAEVLLEAYKAMLFTLALSLEMKASVKILFIKVKFSFHFSKTFTFTIGEDKPAPWEALNAPAAKNALRHMESIPMNRALFDAKRKLPLWIQPIFSLTDDRANYCVAFIPSMDMESFLVLVELLAGSLLGGFDSERTNAHPDAASVGIISDEVDYQWICELLENNVDVTLKSVDYNASANEETNGVVIPMPPTIALRFESEMNEGFAVQYDKDNLVSEQYSDWIKEYFKQLEPNPNRATPREETESKGSGPLAELVFTDYFNMLLKQIHSEVKTYFGQFTILSENMVGCGERYGVSLEKAITDNVYLKVEQSAFTVSKKRYVTKRDDGLRSICDNLAIEASALMESIGDVHGILLQGTAFTINGYAFDLRGLSRKEAAALMFVRWRPLSVESDYQGYSDGIYDQIRDALHVDYDWECVDEDVVIALPDGNGTYRWRLTPGDTVERIAAYWDVYQLPRGENREWDLFLDATVPEGADRLILPETCIYVQTDATLNGLYRRIYPDKPNGFLNEPVFTIPCLKEASLLVIDDVKYVLQEETDLISLISRYGLTVEELAESIANGGLTPVSGQNVTLTDVQTIPKEEILATLASGGFSTELASLSSRFLMQGMRLVPYDERSGYDGVQPTYGYYESMLQQTAYVPDRLDRRLSVTPTRGGEGWISGNMEMLMKWEWILERLPNIRYAWDERLCVPENPVMEPFQSVPACYSVNDIRLIYGERDLTVFFYPDALKRDISRVSELALKRDGDETSFDQALLLPFTVQCSEESDWVKVLGMDAKNRIVLEKLLDMGDLSVGLCCKASTLNAVSEGFLSIPANEGKTIIIKTNLSKETHMHPVIDRMVKRYEDTENYAASMRERDFLRLLWECSVVGGGYYLRLDTNGKNVIPSDVKEDDGTLDLWLLVRDNEAHDLQRAGASNCAMSEETAIPDKLYSFYETDEDNEALRNWMPTFPVGRYGVEFSYDARQLEEMDNDHYDMHEMFGVFGYRIRWDRVESKDSKPLLPVGVEGEDELWRYVAVMPLCNLTGGEEGNPYSALGKRFDFYLYCRDLLGNCINLNNGKRLCGVYPGYNDFVISPSEWPGVALSYDVKKLRERAYLNVYLNFDDDGDKNDASIEKLRLSIWQMEFEYASGSDCPVRISSPLFENGFSVTNVQYDTLIPYLKGIYDYLKGERASQPDDVTLSFEVDAGRIKEKLFPLEVYVHIKRNRLRSSVEKAIQASALITTRVFAAEGGEEKALALFAEDFEDALPGFVLGHSSDEKELYAFKIGRNGLLEYVDVRPYQMGTASYPRYYALKPIHNAPMSQDVYVAPLTGLLEKAEKTLVVFTDIDMEQWARRFIGDLEYFLSEGFAPQLFELERATLNELVDLKKRLAEAIVTRLIPIEDDVDYDSVYVKELLKDRLLRSLESGYRIASIAEYKLKAASEEGIRMSVSCQASDAVLATASKIDPKSDSFCIFYEARNPHTTGFRPDLTFSVEELEYHIGKRGDYESSEWLKLILPITDKRSKESVTIDLTSDLSIPNPLRSCPAPPKMNAQESVFGESSSQNRLTRWNYSLDATLFTTEQDAYHYRVKFTNEDGLLDSFSMDALFQAFAQYDYVRDDLLAAINDDASQIGLFIKLASQIVSSWSGDSMIKKQSERLSGEQTFQCEMRLDLKEGRIHMEYDKDLWNAGMKSHPDIGLLHQSNMADFTLTIKDLNIFERNCAEPTLWIVRNQNVLSNETINLAVNPAFLYRTEEKSLPKLFAFGESLTYRYLGRLESKISHGAILEALTLYSESLELNDADNVCDLVIHYGYSLDDNDFTPKIRMPVIMFNGITCKSVKGNETIAGSVWDWFAIPPSELNNGLIFDITVYSRNEKQTLFRICNVEIGFHK